LKKVSEQRGQPLIWEGRAIIYYWGEPNDWRERGKGSVPVVGEGY